VQLIAGDEQVGQVGELALHLLNPGGKFAVYLLDAVKARQELPLFALQPVDLREQVAYCLVGLDLGAQAGVLGLEDAQAVLQ
jgi:hypothetical protein